MIYDGAMRRSVCLVGLGWALTHAGCGPAGEPQSAGLVTALPPGTLERLGRGVFEVVTPKLEDPRVRYLDDLPDELIPFNERNDRFASVGTAFAIGSQRFLSAAHVIVLGEKTPHERYFLRDSQGAMCEVSTVLRYSQHRDVVEFGCEGELQAAVPLELRGDPQIGEHVFTLGNALGEGIVLRSGEVTSFTPEPDNGEWKYLRYTAPASPGNSGGPLVDGLGRAVGIVIAKTEAENLNYAYPISALEEVSTKRTEFLVRGLTIADQGFELPFDWEFYGHLPRPLREVRAAALQHRDALVEENLATFHRVFEDRIFPKAKGVSAALRSQPTPFGISLYSPTQQGWTVNDGEFVLHDVAPDRHLHARVYESGSGVDFVLERAKGQSVDALLHSPKEILDLVLQKTQWTHTLYGKALRVGSYGAPDTETLLEDVYGRPWLLARWKNPKLSSSFHQVCTTIPAGVSCFALETTWAVGEVIERVYQRQLRRMVLGYHGTLDDWEDYLNGPSKGRPEVLRQAKVKRAGEMFEFALGTLLGKASVAGLSGGSRLFVNVGLDPTEPNHARALDLFLDPSEDRQTRFTVETFFELEADATPGDKALWQDMRARKSPYNNVATTRSGRVRRSLVLPEELGAQPAFLVVKGCSVAETEDRAALGKPCDRWQGTSR